MLNIDELMKQYAKQVAEEKKQFGEVIQTRVPRDSAKRPWDYPEAAKVQPPPPEAAAPANPDGPAWYATWHGLKDAFRRRKFSVQIAFVITLILSIFGTTFIAPTFSSTLHLYAPEKINNIASRMQVFSNRVEFAAFPVDLRVPLGLMARRLRGEIAKAWVLQEFGKHPHPKSVALDPEIVRCETFYADGTELLIIQGYANDPELAAVITNLYWDYLEFELGRLNSEHTTRVKEWLKLTKAELGERLNTLSEQLRGLTALPMSAANAVDERLSSNISESEIRKIRLEKEIEELKAAEQTKSAEKLWLVSLPEIQDLRAVDRALRDKTAGLPAELIQTRRAEIEKQAFETVHQLLAARHQEWEVLDLQTNRLKAQIDKNIQRGEKSKEISDVAQRIQLNATIYKSQLEELGRLGTQIAVEGNLNQARLRVIQPALADETTRRPMLAILFSVCFLLSLFVSVVVLVISEHRRAVLAGKRFEPSPLPSFAEPHAPGLGG